MKLTKEIILEVAQHEGLVRQAYKDSVGVWTWSVGLTDASGHLVERYIDSPASLEHCLGVWLWALQKYADEVEEAFEQPLQEYQKAAALSFHWNTGAIKKATWVKDFNNGKIGLAYKNFMNWSKPKEIIPRREAERQLFFNEKWVGKGTMTEYTEVDSKKRPVWSSAEVINVDEVLEELLSK